MTEIDVAAEIDIVWQEHQVTVRIPLAGQVTQDWCRRYQALAHSKDVPARAEEHPGRGWVVVTMPGSTGRSDVSATMDAVRDLIAEADADEEPQDPEETTAAIREWWAQQRG
jgi:hypothetical protein